MTADHERRPTLTHRTLVQRHPDQAAADLDGEVLVLSLQTGAYYGMRDVAARIWELVRRPTTVGAVSATITAEYEVDADRCAHDTAAFMTTLIEHGLVETRDVAAPEAR
jgi:hypothetical protein